MIANPYEDLLIIPSIDSKEDLSELIGLIEETQEFDDLYISGDRQLVIKSRGQLYRFGPIFDNGTVEKIITIIGKGNDIPMEILGQKQFDPALQINYRDKTRYRYRVNMVSHAGDITPYAFRIVIRSIKETIPTLSDIDLDESDFFKIMRKDGLVLIVGATGSGKSTTLASLLQHMVLHNINSGVLATYESPIEYRLEGIIQKSIEKNGFCSWEIFQHEVGVNLPNYTEAIRNLLRINPDIGVVGELRDQTSIEATGIMAESGHLAIGTLHANGVNECISRLINVFDASERNQKRISFAQSLRAIICQQLISTSKGRVAVREVLFFDDDFTKMLSLLKPEEFESAIATRLKTHGKTYAEHARELFSEGRIPQTELNRILGESK
jgi:twitching motility protein PilU